MRIFQMGLLTGLALSACGPQTDNPSADRASATRALTAAADTTAPTVSLTSPTQGATVTGMVSLQAVASDDYDTPTVDFLVDGVRVAASSAPPYAVTWDSHTVMNGTHTLTTRARDNSYNTSTSAPVTLTVAQPGAAQYDSGLHVPVCSTVGNVCDSTALVQGRGPTGGTPGFEEPHAPSTLDGCADTSNNDMINNPEQIHWLKVSRADGRPFVEGRRVQVDVAVEVPSFSPFESMGLTLYTASDATAPVWTYQTGVSLNPNFYPERRGLYVVSAEYVLPAGGLQAVRAKYWAGTWQLAPCDTSGVYDHDDLAFAVGQEVDVTPPTVSITAPANNAPVSQKVTLQAEADDDFNVTKVEFYDGQALIGVAATKPFSVDWYIGAQPEGTHTLTAKAYDAAGHVTTSAAVSVLIDNTPPFVSFASPANNAFVRGTVALTANASDANGISAVSYYDGFVQNGGWLGVSKAAPYTVSWDTLATNSIQHGIHAVATDRAGNTSETVIAVTVDNVPPTVAITAPANGASVFLSTTIQATASDNNGVTQVAFYDGTKLIGTDTSAPYSVSWSTLLVSKGQHTLTARATDVAGNVTTSAGTVVTVQ